MSKQKAAKQNIRISEKQIIGVVEVRTRDEKVTHIVLFVSLVLLVNK
jgi:hypothetical protein